MVLSRVAAAAGLTRWNSSSTMTFWSPSAGLRLARRTISRAASIGIAAPGRCTMWTSGRRSRSAGRLLEEGLGVLLAERQQAVALGNLLASAGGEQLRHHRPRRRTPTRARG